MKKSLIIGMASVAIIGASLIGTSIYAATSTTVSGRLSLHQNGEYGNKGGRGMGPMMQMTDAEKTAFEAMSATEKQAYIITKRTEAEARRDAHEVVVDKLLAGTILTAEEEKIRQEIITQRTEMKAKRLEMEANREKIQIIRDKQKAGTTLTSEEQSLLDSMPKMGGHRGMGGHMRK
jgi:Spy/CpxP family protein refolding chaperone